MKDQFIDAVEFSIIIDYEDTDSDGVGHKRTLALRVLENETVGECGYYYRIMAGDVPQHAVRMCYCHECYPEPPVRKGEIRYPNLLDHIDAAKSRGIPGEIDVLIAVLRYGFAIRDRKHLAEKMINTITK